MKAKKRIVDNSYGKVMGEHIRSTMNNISDSERDQRLREAMSIIYSGTANGKAAQVCRSGR
jgi:hypothetical protein